MSGVKVTNERPGRAIASTDSVDGVEDVDDNVEWDPAPGSSAGSSELDQWKQPVVAATTANITIATALNAGDTIDGVTLAAGDRVLVKDQTTTKENGIYVAGTTPERAVDMDDDDEVVGAVVYVIGGTTNGGTAWAVDLTAPPVVDTDPITFAAFGGGAGSTPTLAAVLLVGNSADGTAIIGGSGDDLTLKGGLATAHDGKLFLGTVVGTTGGDANVAAGTGQGSDPGGTAILAGGSGASGGQSGEFLALPGQGATHGKVQIRSNNATGSSGNVLTADGSGNATWAAPTGIAGVAAQEDGSSVVASATAFDYRHALDVSAPGGGVARVAVDESEFTYGATGDMSAETPTSTVAAGSSGKPSDAGHRHAMSGFAASGDVPAFATPAIVLGTAAAGGAAASVIRSDATIVAFDATTPAAQALGDAGTVGTAGTAAHRDHKHPLFTGAAPSGGYGTAAAGSAATVLRSDAVLAKPTAPDVDFSADVTNNNVTTGHHGLAPKGDGNAAHYLDATGAYSVPGAVSGGGSAAVAASALDGSGGGDFSTASTSFVDVTSASITITTAARRVKVGFMGTVANNNNTAAMSATVSVDGVDQGGTVGYWRLQNPVANANLPFVMTYMSPSALSAGSHTFKIRVLTSAGTMIVRNNSAGAIWNMWVEECPT